jgi:carbon storage regulator CsrA
MLVLTRKATESLHLGVPDSAMGVVKVTVLTVVGNRVKLGFELQNGVAIHRLEVWQRIHNGAHSEQANS